MKKAVLFVALVALSGCNCGGGGSETDAGTDAGGGGEADAGTRFAGEGHALAVQNGKLIVAGSRAGRGDDFLVARFNTDGTLDPSFGQGGYTTTDFDGGSAGFFSAIDDAALALAVASDGSLFVAGGGRGLSGIPVGGMALAKYTADGQLDTAFSSDGWRILQVPLSGGGFAEALYTSIALQPDGKILVGGYLYNGATNGKDYVISRINADGTTDTTFSDPAGGGGVLKHYGAQEEQVRALFLQGAKVVAAGGADFLAARYNSDGTLDTTFGTSGLARSTGGEATAAVARADGKLVLAGTVPATLPDGGSDVAVKVVQYTADGALDTGFGSGGVASGFFGFQYVKGVVAEPNGNVAVYGSGTSRPKVLRLLPNGSPDETFGPNGMLANTDLLVPLLDLQLSGNHAIYMNGALWFTDTGSGTGENAVIKGDGVIVESLPLP